MTHYKIMDDSFGVNITLRDNLRLCELCEESKKLFEQGVKHKVYKVEVIEKVTQVEMDYAKFNQ